MPQQCNTLGKPEDPLVPQMQKQYLDEKKKQANHKTLSVINHKVP